MSFHAVVPSPLTLLPFRNLLETAAPPTPIHPFPLSFANLTSSLSDVDAGGGYHYVALTIAYISVYLADVGKYLWSIRLRAQLRSQCEKLALHAVTLSQTRS